MPDDDEKPVVQIDLRVNLEPDGAPSSHPKLEQMLAGAVSRYLDGMSFDGPSCSYTVVGCEDVD